MTVEFNLIGVAVTDMPKALAFYRLLGFDIPESADGDPHVEVTLPGGIRLAWDAIDMIRTFDPHWVEPGGGPRINLAFRCSDPAEVDRRYAELTAAGYHGHKEPWDAFWGQRYAVIHDPDGNGVDLFADAK
jgi:catechol 2,3-dioxygenase-like lactoylglutathione lyase family enzyme